MKTVTVVGCGIIGLTTAIILQEKGYSVRIVAEETFEKSLSIKVGAIWFPFEVHPAEKANVWGSKTYERYQLEMRKTKGVSFIPFTVVYNEQSDLSWVRKLPKSAVREALSHEVPHNATMAKVAIVPLAEPPIYLPELFHRFITEGGTFQQQKIMSLQELANLDSLVINCAGLGTLAFYADALLFPMRGQILRCENLDIQSCVNSTQKGALSYVITRSTDCIVGGTDYENDWNMNVEQGDTELILSRLRSAQLSPTDPIILESVVGLRPARKEVRFEFDAQYTHVFHNYGHGGAGFTIGWGCALELVEQLNRNDNTPLID